MKESDYIEATNLARIRNAVDILRDVLPGYGPVTQERKTQVYAPLAQLLDDCYAAIDTSSEFEKQQARMAAETLSRIRSE